MSKNTKPSPDLVAHEEAHALVARWVGWTGVEIVYSSRGGSGYARYSAPSFDFGGWRELYVTLAGIVSDVRIVAAEPGSQIDREVAREVMIGTVMRKARRISRTGFRPKRDNDEWKAARILVAMHPDSLDRAETELREAWAEVGSILDGASSGDALETAGGDRRSTNLSSSAPAPPDAVSAAGGA